jgi:hypothetical protein
LVSQPLGITSKLDRPPLRFRSDTASHNIKFLRSLAEDKEPRLIEAWARANKIDRRRFELLKRAYVEARYSPSYTITADDLEALAGSVERLREIVEALCRERLDKLHKAAE